MKKIVLTVTALALGIPTFAGTGASGLLYNTGYDGSSTYTDDFIDPNWMVDPIGGSPDGSTTVLYSGADNWYSGANGVPGWLANSSLSKWIGTTSMEETGAAGDYAYSQVFSLKGQDPLQFSIFGRWTGADNLVDIVLNGVSLGTDGSGGGVISSAWASWHNFNIPAGNAAFTDGLNRISFVTRTVARGQSRVDGLNAGVRVEFSQSQAVPEPFTMGLMGLGAAAALRRRKRR